MSDRELPTSNMNRHNDKILALLFDLDGTLVNTHKANYEAYNFALKRYGVDVKWEDFAKTIGMQSSQFLPMLAPSLDTQELVAVRETKSDYYQTIAHSTEPNLPLIEFLKVMSKSHKIALVTTAQDLSARKILDVHGLSDYFDAIITAANVENHKPDPEGYLQALSLLGVSAGQALAFEDSESGAQAAHAAGLKVIRIEDFAA